MRLRSRLWVVAYSFPDEDDRVRAHATEGRVREFAIDRVRAHIRADMDPHQGMSEPLLIGVRCERRQRHLLAGRHVVEVDIAESDPGWAAVLPGRIVEAQRMDEAGRRRVEEG